MSDSQREGISPTAIYAYSLALRAFWPVLSGPIVALIVLPIVAIQTGAGEYFHGVDIVDFGFRLAIYFSLGMLAMLVPPTIWIDFVGKRRINWRKLAQRARLMGRQDLWPPQRVWRVVDDSRQVEV